MNARRDGDKSNMAKDQTLIEAIIEVLCCQRKMEISTGSLTVPAESGGRELAKVVCHVCGSEYMLGVITRTREQSLADEAFEHLSEEQEDAIGIDRNDMEPSIEDAALCAACDGDVNRKQDYCSGCKEYICQQHRLRQPGHPRRHMAEEHWEAPKAAMADAAAEPLDDGSGNPLEADADYAPGFRPER